MTAHRPHRFRRDAALVKAAVQFIKDAEWETCPVCGAAGWPYHEEGCAFALLYLRYLDYLRMDDQLAESLSQLTWEVDLRADTLPPTVPPWVRKWTERKEN